MDRFLLAENPMNTSGGATVIVHTIEPKAMIQVHNGHDPIDFGYSKQYSFKNTDGDIEQYTLRLFHYFTEDFNEDNHKPAAYKIMDKAWHWYMAYLKWEDEQN